MNLELLVAPGDGGERVTDRPGRMVAILVDRPEVAVTDSRYGPGEQGPGLHVHRHHADCFWVAEGELTFRVGEEVARAPAGTVVLVPPLVVHTFANEGEADARFINVHAPAMGFAGHLRGEDGFDSEDPPPDGGRPGTEAVVVAASPGDVVALDGFVSLSPTGPGLRVAPAGA